MHFGRAELLFGEAIPQDYVLAVLRSNENRDFVSNSEHGICRGAFAIVPAARRTFSSDRTNWIIELMRKAKLRTV